MANRKLDSVKLGVFVLSGLIILVIALYFIGQDDALFQSNFVLKARFENVGGLVPGHNVRYAGINVGTVKKVDILNDTTIEVTMYVREELKKIIRKNAVVALGTDGIIGNRVVDITPVKSPAGLVDDGDYLALKKTYSTQEMLATLYQTNENVAEISTALKATVDRINNSKQLAILLDDPSLSENLRMALVNIRVAGEQAAGMARELRTTLGAVENGEGNLGILLRDTAMARGLEDAVLRVGSAAQQAEELAQNLNKLSAAIDSDYAGGSGPAAALLRDSVMTQSLQQTLRNVETGTEAFQQNMEALKHNFFFRGYFRRQEKKARENAGQ